MYVKILFSFTHFHPLSVLYAYVKYYGMMRFCVLFFLIEKKNMKNKKEERYWDFVPVALMVC